VDRLCEGSAAVLLVSAQWVRSTVPAALPEENSWCFCFDCLLVCLLACLPACQVFLISTRAGR
jgi:hypothetical protein